ncbi:type II toxin-antitoxin system YafQ family toxin [Thiothrix sp.]|jgi:mRNA interferase YafQ|uniref:type II toxin-antitoxin system YafQ family toxin n=1 Tax=Thiothrix sp. TaxID=1032 RepID=UPI00257B312E|nr:type II toxin-antitoxin system YafQ family toxin [Thiothrix sp.]
MREIKRSSRFKSDYKLMKKRGKDMDKINSVIVMLANDEGLPPSLCDHSLSGNWAGFRDCHVEPDWVLIYKKTDDQALELHELRLEATGTHSDLFK